MISCPTGFVNPKSEIDNTDLNLFLTDVQGPFTLDQNELRILCWS